jgi:hypothetical protein
LRCLGHLLRMQEHNPCRKLTLHKPQSIRRVGRPAVRWLDSVEEDLKATDLRKWRRKSHDYDQCRAIVKEAEAHHGL